MKMKNNLSLLFIMMLYTMDYYPVAAQSLYSDKDRSIDSLTSNDKVSWGLKAGWNYSSLYGKEIDYVFANTDTKYQSGVQLGLFVDTRISNNFGLKHELLFSQRRINVVLSDAESTNYSTTLAQSTIDLMPANLAFHKGGFQLYAGPYISGLVHAHILRKDENGKLWKDKSIFGNAANDESETHYLQKFDFGANMGIAYSFAHGIHIDARYNHGFTDIFQYANSYTNEDSKVTAIKIYNRGFMLSLAYTFGSSKK